MAKVPSPDKPLDFAVWCRTCREVVYQDENPPADGQALLTGYADKSCNEAECPHKTVNAGTRRKRNAATQGDLDDLRNRLQRLEAKVQP